MSSHRTLLAYGKNFDIFAPSWQAGLLGSQCLNKSLNSYKVENVNVVKVCENLCLALNEKSNCYVKTPQYIEGELSQGTVRKANLPFRAFSDIWFSTLKIYQQQVNTLFRLSQDLFSRSSNYKVYQLKACKRKSSLTSNKLVKKRRLTMRESNETLFTTTYSELVRDFEELAKESMQKSLPEISSFTSAPVTQIQIREITMREINVATCSPPPDLIDEDSGFGEATHEEISEFFKFVEDGPVHNLNRIPTNRNSTCGQENPIIKSSAADFSLEALANENRSMCNDTLKLLPLKRSSTPTNITFCGNKRMPNVNVLDGNLVDNKVFFETAEVKKENMSYNENIEIREDTCPNKKRKLILDDCIKIDILENMKEIHTSEISIKVARKRTLKSYRNQKNRRALELLTRFNKRSLKLLVSLKQKFYISREQFERDFLNLLREILASNYNEKWASEIYPKWKYFKVEILKTNKKKRKNKSRKQHKFTLELETDVYNLNDSLRTNITDGNKNEYQKPRTNTNVEWRPTGVMSKLLNLWRFNKMKKIAAATLFKLSDNQIDRALGFNSLLNLSKKHFVNLTTFPGSIELQSILLGKAVTCKLTGDVA